jgi:hypothetical protein
VIRGSSGWRAHGRRGHGAREIGGIVGNEVGVLLFVVDGDGERRVGDVYISVLFDDDSFAVVVEGWGGGVCRFRGRGWSLGTFWTASFRR